MSAIVKADAVERLARAGMLERDVTPPKAALAPTPPDAALAARVADLSKRLTDLADDQLAAVLEHAVGMRKSSDAVAAALGALTKPRQKEKWMFEVVERDFQGHIKTMSARQVD